MAEARSQRCNADSETVLEGRFPRIWTPSGAEKDLRQLLIHRYKLVRMRAQINTELQHLA